jgi:multiple sugar transport system ATP-binding protein
VDLFVAGMVAEPALGLLPARVVATADGACFRVGARTLPLWGPLPAALAPHVDRPVLLGLHGEDVTQAGPAADPASVTLPGTVAAVERTGPDTLVAVQVDPGADALPLWARFPARSGVRRGDRVQVAVDAGRAHVFDPETGKALHHPDDA